MPIWLEAGLWGWLAGGALLIGALLGYYLSIPARLIAAVMAFGSGVLISALSFELMDEAYKEGGLVATASGFIAGAIIYFPFGLYLAPYCGYTVSVLIGFVLFLLQVRFCKWWLSGHKQGPLESIWHKWTWMFSNK